MALIILGSVFSFAPMTLGAVKPTVIVVDFDITVPGLEYEETLPAALTDLMINALINSNRFRVFERRKLDALVTEQGFQHFSGLVDPSTAVQLGRMIGAHFVVTGSITDISRGSGGVRLGPVGFGESSTRVTLTARTVDVATGEILYSVVEKKKATRSQVDLGIGGLAMYSCSSQDIIITVNAMCEQNGCWRPYRTRRYSPARICGGGEREKPFISIWARIPVSRWATPSRF